MDKERVNITKLAIAANEDVESDVLTQSKDSILNNVAKDYGVKTFAELSKEQQDEVLNDIEGDMLKEASKILKQHNSAKKSMKKTAQSFWWSEQRYNDMLSSAEKDKLHDRMKNIFASRRTWPRSPVIDNDAVEELLVEKFMDRLLHKTVPLRSPDYLEDDNVLHVCAAVFLRNFPHLQAQYSASFVPLQKTREDEAEAQSEQEPNPFLSKKLQEKTAQLAEEGDVQATVLSEGSSAIVMQQMRDRDGKLMAAGEYIVIEPPNEVDGEVIISLVPEDTQDDYLPNDICFVLYPNDNIEIIM